MINHCAKVSSVLSHIHVRFVYFFRSVYHNEFYFLKTVTKIKGKILLFYLNSISNFNDMQCLKLLYFLNSNPRNIFSAISMSKEFPRNRKSVCMKEKSTQRHAYNFTRF